MTFNEAATIPLAGLTACSGLYQLLKLPEPGSPPTGTPILVWAGSSIPSHPPSPSPFPLSLEQYPTFELPI
jgi:hypothetical protein